MADTFEAYCEGLKALPMYRSLCEGQQVDVSVDTDLGNKETWKKTVRKEGTNEEYIVERKVDNISKRPYIVTLRPIKFKSATKEITGKSGKTYTVPIVIVPAGSFLYRGVKEAPSTESMLTEYPSGTWFSWVKQTASGYHKAVVQLEDKTQLDTLTFKVKSDLELLDLWTPTAWNSILAEAGADDAALRSFAGISRTATPKSKIANSKNTGMFPSSSCQDTSCETLEWRGLPWGPKIGNYKRKSEDVTDLTAVETIYSMFPDGFDGIFALPTPSDVSSYPGFTNPIPYGVFHEEINLRPGQSNKLEYTRKKGGKKTRRKQKKSKRTRTSKKK